MTFCYKLLSTAFSILTVLTLTHSSTLAQTEITQREYTTEDKTHSDFSFKEKYRYFTRANVEERTLIKVGGSVIGGWGGGGRDGIGVGFIGSFMNVITVEQKLLPPISILAEVENTWISNGKQDKGYAMGGKLGLRWYYFMNKHIREERRANNFSNHYLSLQSNHSLYQTEDRFKRSNMLSLLWGTQIRIGKFGYFDANIGPAIKYSKLAPGESRLGYDANISIGVGF
jgi:hypothetical protein